MPARAWAEGDRNNFARCTGAAYRCTGADLQAWADATFALADNLREKVAEVPPGAFFDPELVKFRVVLQAADDKAYEIQDMGVLEPCQNVVSCGREVENLVVLQGALRAQYKKLAHLGMPPLPELMVVKPPRSTTQAISEGATAALWAVALAGVAGVGYAFYTAYKKKGR